MRIRLRVLGLDLIDLATGKDCTDQPDDLARDLSGGTVASIPHPHLVEERDEMPPLGFTRGVPVYEDRRQP